MDQTNEGRLYHHLTLYCQIIDENGDTLLSDEIK